MKGYTTNVTETLRPIDADYQMYDNTKISSTIDQPKIPVKQMLLDLLNHWSN